MNTDAKLRMDVYQEGQRAFNAGTTCPYNDWRANTWCKGFAAAKAYHETPIEETAPDTRQQFPIPITRAEHIAKDYGYDQVVIVGRRVGGFEHVTTYGIDAANCSVAARIGDFFKHELMGWPR